ncbi:uncharacterized protein TNCV_1265321 [Trichonephila clavipes]|nr:uncharacterized protein TNCV_1265321 [Trichonephila clavipes]
MTDYELGRQCIAIYRCLLGSRHNTNNRDSRKSLRARKSGLPGIVPGLRPYSGSQVMLGFLGMRADQKAKQGAESSQPKGLFTLRRAKSIISTFIEKYSIVTKNTKILGKPWKTLITMDEIPRQLERAEAVACFCLTTGHDC